MNKLRNISALTVVLIALGSASALGAGHKVAGATIPNAAELLARHAAMAPRLANNEFGRPLVLESQEATGQVSGDVYAVIDSPFSVVRKSFAVARTWCDVLILHINTKYCRAGIGAGANQLSVRIGRKFAQDLDKTFAMQFAFQLDAVRPDYLAARVTSPSGPFGSHDYGIELQAVPLAAGKSFLRLHYGYSSGGMARLATEGYLATSGSDKVGFTRVDIGGGKLDYVHGLRGAIERNTMRYYLAVEAYTDSLQQPPGRQFNCRIEHWFDATEQYRLQLHEMDRDSYLAMKRSEYLRQLSVAVH